MKTTLLAIALTLGALVSGALLAQDIPYGYGDKRVRTNPVEFHDVHGTTYLTIYRLDPSIHHTGQWAHDATVIVSTNQPVVSQIGGVWEIRFP